MRYSAATALFIVAVLSFGDGPLAKEARAKCEGLGKRRMLRCEVRRLDPPGGYAQALSVALCESGPDLADRYRGDGYAGPFQQATRYWDTRFGIYTRRWDGNLVDDVANYRSNVVVSLRLARDAGWGGHWPSCA